MATRAPGRPRGRPAKTRAEIVEAAGDVFRRLGYERARMDDVAAALGITKSSLYHYVRTKEELLFETILPPYRDAVSHLRAVLDEDRPAPDSLAEVIRLHVANVDRHYPAISIYLENGRHLPVPKEVRRLDREYVAGVKRLVADGMREGTLRVQDPAVAASALLGMCNWFAVRYDPAAGWDVDEVAAAFADIALRGMATPAGGALPASDDTRRRRRG